MMSEYAFVDEEEEEEETDMPVRGDAFYAAALASTSLSADTKRSYDSKLRRLQDITGVHHTVQWVLTHPTAVYKSLVAKTADSTTRAVCITAVLSIFRHIPSLKKEHEREHMHWSEHMRKESKETAKRYNDNKPTPRQAAAHVPWAQVVRARDALAVESREYLLMSMYTMHPPARADYDRLAIRYKAPTAEEVKTEPNYLLIKGPSTMIMYLNAYKTKKAGGEGMTQELPPHLCAVIKSSLDREPRDFMFTEVRSGRPFKDAAAYTVWGGRVLKRVLGNKNASFNTLRHSFLSWLSTQEEKDVTEGDRKDVARLMMHGLGMAGAYVFNEGDKKRFVVADMALPGARL